MEVHREGMLSNDEGDDDDDDEFGFRVMRYHYVDCVPQGVEEMTYSCCETVCFKVMQEGDGGAPLVWVGLEGEGLPRSKRAIVGMKT
jgi:hypothetical protein